MCNTSHFFFIYAMHYYDIQTPDLKCDTTQTTILPTFQRFHILSNVSSFKNWNIVYFSYKATPSEDIDKINQVILDVISEKISEFSQTGKYGAINTTYITTMDYYVIK